MAFIHSWLPKCVRTVPSVAFACSRSLSIHAYSLIVSSPLHARRQNYYHKNAPPGLHTGQ